MSWQPPAKPQSVGLSSHKQSYKAGTLLGNWFEERERRQSAAKQPFAATSVAHQDYGNAQEKAEAAKQYERHDLGRGRTDEAGKAFVAARDVTGQPQEFFATVNQLSYGAREAAAKPPQVQQFLWTGDKHVDLGIPASLPQGDSRAADLTATKHSKWRQDGVPEPFTTTKTMASRPVEAAVSLGETAKRQSARPADDSGAPAPVGKKVDGEFIRSMDADWRHTGLRSPITAKGAKLSPVTAGR